MPKFIVIRPFDERIVAEDCVTSDAAIEAVKTDMDDYGGDPEDYAVYEVTNKFKYVPPQDNGSLVSVEK